MTDPISFDRRAFIGGGTALAAMAGLHPAWAHSVSNGLATKAQGTLTGEDIRLTIATTNFSVDGRPRQAVAVNGTIPAPLIRLKEGQNVRLTVENRLNEDTSIHWHGFIVPFQMDGVPGLSFPAFGRARTLPTSFRSSSQALTGITAIAGSRSNSVTMVRS